MKNIYILRTHKWNAKIEQNFSTFLSMENAYVVHDDTRNKEYPAGCEVRCFNSNVNEHPNERYLLVNEKECKQTNPLHSSLWEHPNTLLEILANYFEPLDYDHMWVVEYDVYCHGDWKSCLLACDGKTEDFLATELKEYPQSRAWYHWKTKPLFKVGKSIKPPVLNECIKCFFPVTRYSKRFLRHLNEKRGHCIAFCEIYVPTICKLNAFTIGDVEKEIIGSYFSYSSWKDKNKTLHLPFDNRLYHPDK